jgi:FKBP-type peptidyl-prolyl cis-trans isomerase 2
MVQKIPLDKIPEKLRSQLKIGGFLMLQSPVGQQMPAKISAMDKESVTLDLNHPLAGKDLTFNINIVDISIPDPNDNSHGHGHDCGCGCDDDCHDDCGCGDDCKDC